jgi:hypothetical protein
MMTKTVKAVIFFINMRITVKHGFGQLFLLCCLAAVCACTGKSEDASVIPPVTSPLSRDYIGFGVITTSFIHVTSDPADDSPSLGYLRRGSFVRIVRRQSVKNSGGFQTWVLIDDPQYGWLKEEVMDIYNSEGQARTASESAPR